MRSYINVILIMLVVFASCKKEDVQPVSFDVSASATSVKQGDTVLFNFLGNPDIITFYSGEKGSRYDMRKRDSALGAAKFSFSSSSSNGTQINTLQLLASTDFSGVYDSANIMAATWTDITNRATLGLTSTTVSSGQVDITDLAAAGKPVFLAFKYLGYTSATSGQKKWTISNIALNNILPDTTYPVFSSQAKSNSYVVPSTDWKSVNIKNASNVWTASTTTLTITGGTANNSPENEDWIVSSPLKLWRAIPEMGTAVKNMSMSMQSYPYIFKKAGTYNVVFVASNQNVYGATDALKQMTITVQ